MMTTTAGATPPPISTTTITANDTVPNLDDLTTDTRSSPSISSSVPICSFDNKTLDQEADKQILEWASKLELETIELREKSTILIDIFNKKKDELNNCVKLLRNLLNGINLQSISKISDELDVYRNEQNDQFNVLQLKIMNIEKQIMHFTKLFQSQQSNKNKNKKAATEDQVSLSSKKIEWICTNINDQLSQMTCFMSSISSELNNVVKRQIKLEERLERTNIDIITSINSATASSSNSTAYLDGRGKRLRIGTEQRVNAKTNGKINGVQTPVLSQSQQTSINKETIASKFLIRTTNTTSGPITRARSKRLREELENGTMTTMTTTTTMTTEINKKHPVNSNTNNETKRHRHNRTLIPWEDINKELTVQDQNNRWTPTI
ncbi:hypothetical protein RI543_004721 [Arxiozyma heterogenica]|uniref:Uncharacterized protein n=1 Tax=Arxiozyma heterogenica TaxID=278026 RepID=A0AAN8A6L9_9SACH|nr:hypothetical protein RI543_004721 [Kazachstania heterogenica]